MIEGQHHLVVVGSAKDFSLDDFDDQPIAILVTSQDGARELGRYLYEHVTVERPEWVVKRDGLYFDTDGVVEDRWVKRQREACRFIERANAKLVAARTGGRIFRLVPTELPSDAKDGG